MSRLHNYELPFELLAIFFHSFSFIGNLYVLAATQFYFLSFQIFLTLLWLNPLIAIPAYSLIKNHKAEDHEKAPREKL